MQPNWKDPAYYPMNLLTSDVRRWLLHPYSMTKQLRQACECQNKPFAIKIVTEQLELLPANIVEKIKQSCRFAYTREVQIFSGETILMYAKSSFLKTQNFFLKRKFRGLGLKPLGEILFQSSQLNRSSFEIAKIHSGKEFNLTTLGNDEQSIWARQSYFFDQEPFLLLTEYFSPNLFLLDRK